MNPDNVPIYIEELQTFSATHRVPAGQPGDLFALSSVLASNDRFRSEFGSMVRSFRYREHEGIIFPEILALITAAWGGPTIVVPPGLPPPWRAELSLVLREILNRPPGEPPPIFEEDEAAEPEPPTEISPAVATHATAPEPSVPPVLTVTPPDPWAEGSWLHQQVQLYESTHPRQLFTRP